MASVRVPPPLVNAFKSLRDLPKADATALIGALSEARPTLRVETLATSAAAQSTLDVDVVTDIVRALASLTALRRLNDWTVDEAAARISDSEDLETPKGKKASFARRVVESLGTRSISLLGKATDMATEHDKVFLGSRVLTDLRPIFGDDVAKAPGGAVLSHTLKVEFVHDEGTLGNTYIVLDEEDLKSLKADLERAEVKAATMKRMLTKLDIVYLGPEG